MNKILFTILISMLALHSSGQVKDTLIKKLDSLSKQTDSAGGQQNNTSAAAYNEQTKITFRGYFILLGSDIKQEFTKPFHMHHKDWGKLGVFTLTTLALGLVDRPIQREALELKTNNPKIAKVSRAITSSGGPAEFYTLGALTAYGFIFKNEKIRTTTLLASQAYLTGSLIEGSLKFLTGRTRPSFYDPAGTAKPRFLGPFGNTSRDFNGDKSNSSFPSGHATVAFAAATVFAMEYKHTLWVPIFSYSAATLIALSRITENKHWATDVFVGSVLGYLSGRNIVNNYHRYAKLKAPNMPKNTVTFNLEYNEFHQVAPALVYHIL